MTFFRLFPSTYGSLMEPEVPFQRHIGTEILVTYSLASKSVSSGSNIVTNYPPTLSFVFILILFDLIPLVLLMCITLYWSLYLFLNYLLRSIIALNLFLSQNLIRSFFLSLFISHLLSLFPSSSIPSLYFSQSVSLSLAPLKNMIGYK